MVKLVELAQLVQLQVWVVRVVSMVRVVRVVWVVILNFHFFKTSLTWESSAVFSFWQNSQYL